MSRNQLYRDIHDADEVDRLMRQRRAVDLSPAVSDPREVNLSDHFRISSPNRSQASGTMRHRRVKR